MASPVHADPHPEARVTGALIAFAAGLAAGSRELVALILAGSMARGESSWLALPEGLQLLGDADVLLVFREDSPLPGAAVIHAWEQTLSSGLTRDRVLAQISLHAVRPSYFSSLPPHIFGYELKYTGRVLWGDPSLLDWIPPISPDQIPLEDAWRLLANRINELLPALCAQPVSHCRSPYEAVPWVKLYLDLATSYLIFTGCYEPTYSGRLRRLRAHAGVRPWEGDEAFALPPEVINRVGACTAWKLAPLGVPFPLARPGACLQAIRDAEALWCWELHRLTGAPLCLGRRELWRRWLRRQPAASRLRGWASALRRQGWAGRRHWPRWLHMAARASPRHWVYEAATELFFARAQPVAAAWVHLPLTAEDPGLAPPLLAAEINRNFRLLIQSTRS